MFSHFLVLNIYFKRLVQCFWCFQYGGVVVPPAVVSDFSVNTTTDVALSCCNIWALTKPPLYSSHTLLWGVVDDATTLQNLESKAGCKRKVHDTSHRSLNPLSRCTPLNLLHFHLSERSARERERAFGVMRREWRGCSGEDNCHRSARRSPLHSFVTVSVSF